MTGSMKFSFLAVRQIMRTCCLFIALLLASQTMAQDVSEESLFANDMKHEFGVNMTSILSTVLGNELNGFDPGRFPISYKRLFKNNKALRLGLGGNINIKNSDNFFSAENSQNAVIARIGFEKRWLFDKRWMAYAGVDLMIDYSSEKSFVITQVDAVLLSINRKGVGIGPVYGLQFAITRRLVLGTEGSLYAFYHKEEENSEFSFSPGFGEQMTSHTFAAELSVPKWLYFVLRF